ncbi:transposase domain-containing protein [Ralstonia pseudosolanacearum]
METVRANGVEPYRYLVALFALEPHDLRRCPVD